MHDGLKNTSTERISREIPFLRRYARALTGNQASGDALVKALLEALLAEPAMLDKRSGLRVGLYKAFHRLWRSSAHGDEAFTATTTDTPEAVVRDRLGTLSSPMRQALLLTVIEGFSSEDVASILELDADHVDALVKSAMDELDAQTRARVLIIEDEPLIALDIEAIVREAGHDVIRIADTHEKATLAAQQEQPDLVLADIQLADGSSGLDAVGDIVAEASTPVVFITAYPERLLSGQRPEPAFLISKPFLPETVKTAVGQALFFRENARPA